MSQFLWIKKVVFIKLADNVLSNKMSEIFLYKSMNSEYGSILDQHLWLVHLDISFYYVLIQLIILILFFLNNYRRQNVMINLTDAANVWSNISFFGFFFPSLIFNLVVVSRLLGFCK